ncbi:MAG: RND transporter, partial [Rubrivivax sp.]|nr:RND transporter [Rubrivivax sp.]
MRRRRSATGTAGLSAALAIVLGACTTAVLPPAPQLSSTAPAAWQAPAPGVAPPVGGALASDADLLAWWGRFKDPLLTELVDAAQSASPGLATAAARVERARATRAAAGSAAGP